MLCLLMTVERPWGSFEILAGDDKFWYKRIVVLPGKRLSLQKHRYRDEFWIIEAGEGTVTIGDVHFPAKRGTTFFIPKGTLHRISCTSKLSLIFTEVAMGIVSEDDIVRVEDDFDRL
jgi:mannose-6-phosphate isomerase-like protein (cupin superfamily)